MLRRYTRKGVIQLKVSLLPGEDPSSRVLNIEVQDRGTGIDEQKKRYLFRMFHVSPPTLTCRL